MSGDDTAAADAIGMALATLTMGYRDALALAQGNVDLVAVFLPDGWIKLAADTHSLLVVEAVRGGMLAESHALANERPVLCLECGAAVFSVMWDTASDTGRTVCARCGGELHV